MAAFLEHESNHRLLCLINYKAQYSVLFFMDFWALQNQITISLSTFISYHNSQSSYAPIILNYLQFLVPLQISFPHTLYLKKLLCIPEELEKCYLLCEDFTNVFPKCSVSYAPTALSYSIWNVFNLLAYKLVS